MKKILLTLLSLSSIYFAQSQCEIYATTAIDSANCNETIDINLAGYSSVFVNELFTPTGPTDTNWASTSGAIYTNPYIPSNQGGGYFWMGTSPIVPTSLTTAAFDMSGSSNGQICFEMAYAVQSGPSPTEGPDEYDEGVTLQYNTGSGWVDIVYYAPNGDTLPSNPLVDAPNVNSGTTNFNSWTNFCIDIPAAAFTSSVQFQWIQEEHTSPNNDHWGLDDIQIVSSEPGYNIFFLNNAQLVGPSPDTVQVEVLSDTSFYFLYSNGINFCRDTLDMFINPTTAHSTYDGSCDGIGYFLDVTGVDSSSIVSWSPATGLDNPNIHTPYANPASDQMYIVTSDCGVDSTFVNVVPAFTATATASTDSICVGDVTTLTATSDQPTFNYTYEWTPATLSPDTTATTTAFPSTNTTYLLTMTSDSGCVKQDSVTIYVGAVPKTIDYIGDMRICHGDSTQITVVPTQPTFFDDFNQGANPSIWQDIQNGTPNTDCGSITGDALHFDGTGDRYAQLYPVDATLGGSVKFMLIYGSSFALGDPCADVSFNDVMTLEYSINGGTSWNIINTYVSNGYDNWTFIEDTLPAAAWTANTLIRLNQETHTGNDRDNWAIDDFLVEMVCSGAACVQYSYLWSPATYISDVNSNSPYFYPEESTYYSVSISPQGFNCNAAADSILISVDELDLSVSPEDTVLCEPNSPLLLEADIEGYETMCNEGYTIMDVPYTVYTGTGDTMTFSAVNNGATAAIPIPFQFEYFCQIVPSVIAQTNGVLNMQDNGFDNTDAFPTVLPNTGFSPDGIIAMYWDDLHQPATKFSTYFIVGTAPNRKMVFDFDLETGNGFGTGANIVKGQIVLHETTNVIDITCIDCQQPTGFAAITQGIENYNGTIGYPVPGRNLTAWNATNETKRFVPTHSPINFQINWTPNIDITSTDDVITIVSPSVSTDYTVNVLNINNCLFTATATVDVYQSNISLSSDVSTCFGDSIQLLASGADTYEWSPNLALSDSSIANPLSGTTVDQKYYVTFTTDGCEEIDSVSVDILNLSSAIINNNVNPVKYCSGTSAELSVVAQNGWVYTWEDANDNVISNSASVDVMNAGTYTVSFNDGVCENTSSVNVEERPNPIIDFTDVEKVLCCNDYDEEVIFTDIVSNVSIASVKINEDLQTGTSYTYTSEGENYSKIDWYKIVSTDGCEAQGYLEIATKCLNPSFTNPDTVYVNTPIAFDLTTADTDADNITYTWTTTETGNAIQDVNIQNAVFNGIEEGQTHTADVEVVATYGSRTCTEEAPSNDYIVLELSDPAFPDAFTPNGDGINDYYHPIVNVLAKTAELRIYNRWGDIVYDLKDDATKLGWDGRWNSKDQPSDLYMYYIKVVHPDGREFLEEGDVSLIR